MLAVLDEELRNKIYEYLAANGLKKTSQRDALIETIFGTKEHFTAEMLLAMARERNATVSRATVYRTLPLLVQSGYLREMDFGRDQKYYDPNYVNHPHHNHLICMDCDRILEFEDINIDTLEECISKRMGFLPLRKTVRIEAKCDELARTGICRNQLAARV